MPFDTLLLIAREHALLLIVHTCIMRSGCAELCQEHGAVWRADRLSDSHHLRPQNHQES